MGLLCVVSMAARAYLSAVLWIEGYGSGGVEYRSSRGKGEATNASYQTRSHFDAVRHCCVYPLAREELVTGIGIRSKFRSYYGR